MIAAAAFCPEPPLLHPAVLGPAGQDMGAELRSACSDALGAVLGTEPDGLLVLGASSAEAVFGPGDAGDLSGYGVPVELPFDGVHEERTVRNGNVGVPLPHLLGAWLLDQAGFTGERIGLSSAVAAPHLRAASSDRRRWAMLVMGDGSARRNAKSPGWYDPDAVGFDAAVTSALGTGHGRALLDLDQVVGARVLAAGLASWRAAGAILESTPMVAALHYAGAPFGVFYVVASWVRQL